MQTTSTLSNAFCLSLSLSHTHTHTHNTRILLELRYAIPVLAGLGLKSSSFQTTSTTTTSNDNNTLKQMKQLFKFCILVQFYSFGIVSGVVYGITRILLVTKSIDEVLATGIILCSCLSMTMAAVIVFTRSSNGNEGMAIANSAIANISALLVTPGLIVLYTRVGTNCVRNSMGDTNYSYGGSSSSSISSNNNEGNGNHTNSAAIFLPLLMRVALPLIFGLLLQWHDSWVYCGKFSLVSYMDQHTLFFRKAQLYAILYIVYTVFCTTFYRASSTSSSTTTTTTTTSTTTTAGFRISQIVMLIMVQLFLLLIVNAVAWITLSYLFPDEPKLRVMGLFGCSQKSVRSTHTTMHARIFS